MPRIIDGSNMNITGRNIKYYRKKRNLSQQELSICRGSISRIEDGSRTVTDIELQGLSQVLQIPIENFFNANPLSEA